MMKRPNLNKSANIPARIHSRPPNRFIELSMFNLALVTTALFILPLLLFLPAAPAMAGSHLWRFSEFYSSPDRSIQFIEMQEIGGSEGEVGIQGHWFETNSYNASHTELLGTNLPFGTANKKFLVGTVSYAALSGVPAPDYIVPDGIIEPDGDFINWWFYQSISIPAATMPSDGVLSITVVDATIPTFSVGINSPTNFAGDTGSVNMASPTPTQAPFTSMFGAVSLVVMAAAVGAFMTKRRIA